MLVGCRGPIYLGTLDIIIRHLFSLSLTRIPCQPMTPDSEAEICTLGQALVTIPGVLHDLSHLDSIKSKSAPRMMEVQTNTSPTPCNNDQTNRKVVRY